MERLVEDRKMVYLAIDSICKGRVIGNLPAKRMEIRKFIRKDITIKELDVVMQWLQRHKLITNIDGGWKVNEIEEFKRYCWIHGRNEPCLACARRLADGKAT